MKLPIRFDSGKTEELRVFWKYLHTDDGVYTECHIKAPDVTSDAGVLIAFGSTRWNENDPYNPVIARWVSFQRAVRATCDGCDAPVFSKHERRSLYHSYLSSDIRVPMRKEAKNVFFTHCHNRMDLCGAGAPTETA